MAKRWQDMDEDELREAILAEMVRDATEPVERRVADLHARVCMLEVGLVRATATLERLVALLDRRREG